MTEHEAAYVAGFIDGEGSILIYKRKSYPSTTHVTMPHNLRVTLTNTHEGVMRWLHETCGGALWAYKRQAGERANRAKAWKWTILSRQACAFLETIEPFLKVKKTQAQVAIEFQRHVTASKRNGHPGHRGQPPTSQADLAYRDTLAQRLYEIRAADKQTFSH